MADGTASLRGAEEQAARAENWGQHRIASGHLPADVAVGLVHFHTLIGAREVVFVRKDGLVDLIIQHQRVIVCLFVL